MRVRKLPASVIRLPVWRSAIIGMSGKVNENRIARCRKRKREPGSKEKLQCKLIRQIALT